MRTNDIKPDSPLNSEQRALVAKLTASDIAWIDERVLDIAKPRWRKVAMIVAELMRRAGDRFPGVPDIYFAERVDGLITAGRLEAQGHRGFMLFCEVRLQAPGESQ